MASHAHANNSNLFEEDEGDIFGDLNPFVLPAHLAHLGEGGSGSGSRSAGPGEETAVIHGFADAGVQEMDWEEERQDNLVPELIRHWMNERLAPDILDQRGELIQRVLERVREQAGLVQRLRGDPEASEDEHFQIILVQTEVERVRFIVRSYMRSRIHKIEKYAHHILENPNIQLRLSTMEYPAPTESYAALIDSQFDISVLNALPAWTQREGQIWHGPSTISRPDNDTSLFVHALQDCEHILLPNGEPKDIRKGSIGLFRYSTIENNLRRREVELV
ncbi:Sld5-domain-containing protein [Ramaria rubella]|nr:Sld5-domain-containing protein [Ramaria rubella]